MAIIFGAIADDDTGATDLAGMLAEQDVRTVLAIDLPSPARLSEMAESCDAIVIAVASRAIGAAEAYQRTLRRGGTASRSSPSHDPDQVLQHFRLHHGGKHWSFDRRRPGRTAGEFYGRGTRLAINGRTTYMGYHFVHRQLLSDSPMRAIRSLR